MAKTGTTKYQSLFRLADLSEVHMRTSAQKLPVLTKGMRIVLAFQNWLQQEFVIADATNFKSDPPTLDPKGAWGTIISRHGIGEVFDLPEAECNVVSAKVLEVHPCAG